MIHAELIRDQSRFVADYAGKAVKRRSVSYDDVLILPRAIRELQDERASLYGPDKEIKDLMSASNLSLETVQGLCRVAEKSCKSR